MNIIFYILLFLLGSIMGSFAGVIIERGRGGFERSRLKDIFGGRSFCPGCGQTLTWWQLIPVVGRLVQKGKCFRCGLAIPSWYNGFETSMGIVFVITAWIVVGNDLTNVLMGSTSGDPLIFWLIVNWAFRAIIVADFFWYELNVYLRLFLVVWIVGWGIFGDILPFQTMFTWGMAWTAIFGIIWRASKRYVRAKLKIDGEGIGEGDIMTAMVIGFLFPFLTGSTDIISSVQLACIYLIASSGLGIIFWLIRMGIDGDRSRMLPFLPAMIVAYWLLLYQGESILRLIQI